MSRLFFSFIYCFFITLLSSFLPPQMHLNSFFTFSKPYHFLSISTIFTILWATALSVDQHFKPCNVGNCGNGPNISYPFWIANQQQSYCGLPNFEVTCDGKNLVVSISGDKYIIKDIFYSNNSLRLASKMLLNFDNSCPLLRHNFSTETTPFDNSPSYADLFFFYNCSENPTIFQTYPVSCASNSTHHSFAVFHIEILKQHNYSIDSCQSLVNAPVESRDIRKLLKMNFTDVLREGFVLQWNQTYCNDCQRSGGSCRSVDNEFTCFCADKPHSRTCDDGVHRLPLILGTVIPGVILLPLLILLIFRYRKKLRNYISSCTIRRKTSSDLYSKEDLEEGSAYFGIPVFSYSELKEVTHNFDPSKELGDGGFGIVYYGKLRDGREVAVKRLYEHNYKRVAQFLNEIEILTNVRHPSLVTLYGCTSRHSRELLLVYEYIPNGTVADHLHGDRAKDHPLPWPVRMNIAIETATALAYLHASEIVHRDVKTNNILLDNNFRVKVADFGLSRLFPNDVSHVSTAPQGTPGYVDPEYHHCYQLTDKSDVYSFGVVLIELISSLPAVDFSRHRHEINLAELAIDRIQNSAFNELIDSSLGFESDSSVERMTTSVAEVAFQCLQLEREMRPSMNEVLEALKGIQEYKDEEIGKMPPPSPDGDNVELLKSSKVPPSPKSVTSRWVSSSNTTISESVTSRWVSSSNTTISGE